MATTTFGTAHHPFRATLPPRVLRPLPQHEPEVQARIVAAERAAGQVEQAGQVKAGRRRWRITAQDARDFLIAYIACFMAVSAWIG